MSGTRPPPDIPDTPSGQPATPSGETAAGAQPPRHPADTVSFGSGGPAGPIPLDAGPDSRPPRGHMGKVIGIAAALTLIAGGGAFAFVEVDPLNLFESGPQAAEAVPDTALAYLGVDLDPSAVQKVNALRFLNHFPAFTDLEGITDDRSDVRKAIFDEALKSADCTDLTFDDDVEPWLGYKFGVGLMPPSGESDEPAAAFAVEVTDHDKAAEGLQALADCDAAASRDGGPGYASVGDFMLMAETQDLADAYAHDVQAGSLADKDEFKADMDALGDLGVATAWADVAAIVDVLPEDGGFDDPAATSVPDLDMLTSTFSRAAATFRFSSDHVELVTKIYGDTTDVDHSDNEVVGLPDSTVFAISEAGGGDRLAASWDSIKETIESEGVDLEQELASLEDETGFAIPEDIETLLGDNVLLSVDADGLTADAFEQITSSGDLSQLNIGIRFRGEGDKLDDLYDRILDLLEGSFTSDLPFEKVDFDDGFVLATNGEYGGTLAGLDGDLGESEQFQSVVPDAADNEFVVYFDWDQVEDAIVEAARNDGASEDDIDNLRPLRAFGLSSETEGDYTTYTFRMSVND